MTSRRRKKPLEQSRFLGGLVMFGIEGVIVTGVVVVALIISAVVLAIL